MLLLNPHRFGGGVNPGVSYRYFFIEFLTTGNGWIGCSTLSAFDAVGTDHALQSNGGTASAVGYTPLGGWEVTRVNDGNDGTSSTSTASAAGSGKGIVLDLGSVETIQRIGYRSRHDGSGDQEAILTGNVYGKVLVGDSWTLIRAVDEIVWADAEYRDWYLVPYVASSTQWRVAVKNTQSGGNVIFREIEHHETIGGANIATTGSAAAASSGANAGNAYDGNSSTFWQATLGTNQWNSRTYGTAKTIVEFSLQIHTAIGDGAKEAALQFYNGAGWTTAIRPPTIVWSSSDQTQTFS